MSTTGRVLVTGATGCVGRFVVPRLVARGWDVRAVHGRTTPARIEGVRWVQANLLDQAEADRIISSHSPTHLLHLAWSIAPGQWAMAPENIEWARASLALFHSFQAAGGRRIVGAGSCLEYDWSYGYCAEDRTPFSSRTLYGTSKHAVQLLLSAMSSASDMTSAWGRIFFLYGPGEHPDRLVASVIRALLAGQPARTSHGRQIRDYLYADDVADAFVRLLEGDLSGPVNIGSGRPVALREISQRIGELMGRPDLVHLGALPPAPTDTPLVVADTTRLSTQLNWTPEWDLDRGLRATIDWWKAQ
jgi:nucleoside-diphosphate-sugar epimerase